MSTTTSLFQILPSQPTFNNTQQQQQQQQNTTQNNEQKGQLLNQPPSLFNLGQSQSFAVDKQQQQQQPYVPKKELIHTAPIFFVSSQKEEKKKQTMEPVLTRSGSISLNYGDRRLSNILSDSKTSQTGSNVGKKRILLEVPDPSRGLFGDGNVYKRNKGRYDNIDSYNSSTIRVYGFPTHLFNDLKQYFEKYGNVTECKRSLADWVLVTFENNAAATQALKENNTEIYGYPVRIIPHIEPSTTIRQGVITLEESEGIFKQEKPKELGHGKEGITAFDGRTIADEEYLMKPVDNSITAKLKEIFFGW
ncbi:hypothetical protein BCV72DRAFT_202274 [Rhizopus microsporus var. microsporus]|uniref:RRM Nup35-type domain-containing protein n=1 Tax=Rhizopus microsporus var. microsporus TaxID=86635 RepID=A0A1X0RAS8_RHIZD|nr:hypothetical protein BCV72DRAFT_202274 [Rhizopus microsporus var. microsporus]